MKFSSLLVATLTVFVASCIAGEETVGAGHSGTIVARGYKWNDDKCDSYSGENCGGEKHDPKDDCDGDDCTTYPWGTPPGGKKDESCDSYGNCSGKDRKKPKDESCDSYGNCGGKDRKKPKDDDCDTYGSCGGKPPGGGRHGRKPDDDCDGDDCSKYPWGKSPKDDCDDTYEDCSDCDSYGSCGGKKLPPCDDPGYSYKRSMGAHRHSRRHYQTPGVDCDDGKGYGNDMINPDGTPVRGGGRYGGGGRSGGGGSYGGGGGRKFPDSQGGGGRNYGNDMLHPDGTPVGQNKFPDSQGGGRSRTDAKDKVECPECTDEGYLDPCLYDEKGVYVQGGGGHECPKTTVPDYNKHGKCYAGKMKGKGPLIGAQIGNCLDACILSQNCDKDMECDSGGDGLVGSLINISALNCAKLRLLST